MRNKPQAASIHVPDAALRERMLVGPVVEGSAACAEEALLFTATA
jgi:hypothetical protein